AIEVAADVGAQAISRLGDERESAIDRGFERVVDGTIDCGSFPSVGIPAVASGGRGGSGIGPAGQVLQGARAGKGGGGGDEHAGEHPVSSPIDRWNGRAVAR